MKNKVIEKDLELLNAIGLNEDDLYLADNDISLVIKCFDKDYYSREFKVKDTCYCPFVGIYDLGFGLFRDYYWIIPTKTFEETTKLIALMHGTKSLDANLSWLVSDVEKPSISECICFRDELSRLDSSNEDHKGFLNEVKYLPLRDWVERHTKIIFGIAIVFLKDPVRYYKALYSLYKEAFKITLENKNNNNFIIENRDPKIDIAYASILDLEDRGFNPEEIFKDE